MRLAPSRIQCTLYMNVHNLLVTREVVQPQTLSCPQFAVQQLVSVPHGELVKIGVNHHQPASPEINSSPSSPLSTDILQFFVDPPGSTMEQLETYRDQEQRTLRSVSAVLCLLYRPPQAAFVPKCVYMHILFTGKGVL